VLVELVHHDLRNAAAPELEHDADALAVQKDPLGDIGVLTSPENLITVWKSGQAIDRSSR